MNQTQDGYPVLKLNKLSLEILRRERNVEMPAAPVEKYASRSEIRSHPVTLEPREMGLFEYLRSIRKQLADAKGVAPFVIFSDSTLYAMVRQRPQNQEQFADVPGVGVHKLAAYGLTF